VKTFQVLHSRVDLVLTLKLWIRLEKGCQGPKLSLSGPFVSQEDNDVVNTASCLVYFPSKLNLSQFFFFVQTISVECKKAKRAKFFQKKNTIYK
jgi:hypothetical protein